MIPTTLDMLETVDAELPAFEASSNLMWRRLARFLLLGVAVVLLSPVLLVFCTFALFIACAFGVPICGDRARTRL